MTSLFKESRRPKRATRCEGGATTFQKLIKKTNLDVEERTFSVCYYETRKMNVAARYSAEVAFHAGDHMILDADSVKGLETKLACLVRASFYSRMLFEIATPV